MRIQWEDGSSPEPGKGWQPHQRLPNTFQEHFKTTRTKKHNKNNNKTSAVCKSAEEMTIVIWMPKTVLT